jgi:hypothetical protein
MTATYNDQLLTDLDRARALLGDTDTGDPLLSNAHINAVIAIEGGLKAGVAALCEELIARFLRDPVKKSADGISVDYTDRLAEWRRIAASARVQAAGGGLSFVRANYTGEAAADEFARPPDYWP